MSRFLFLCLYFYSTNKSTTQRSLQVPFNDPCSLHQSPSVTTGCFLHVPRYTKPADETAAGLNSTSRIRKLQILTTIRYSHMRPRVGHLTQISNWSPFAPSLFRRPVDRNAALQWNCPDGSWSSLRSPPKTWGFRTYCSQHKSCIRENIPQRVQLECHYGIRAPKTICGMT